MNSTFIAGANAISLLISAGACSNALEYTAFYSNSSVNAMVLNQQCCVLYACNTA
jgi:hypothetical protein